MAITPERHSNGFIRFLILFNEFFPKPGKAPILQSPSNLAHELKVEMQIVQTDQAQSKDLFRVEKRELSNLGLEEYFGDPRAICLVEWPEIARELLPKNRMEIRFAHRKDARSLCFRA